ncbi:MAG: hypothetical protein AAF773_05240 [Cyanobacteria bacterium P01_D01_bin.115]
MINQWGNLELLPFLERTLPEQTPPEAAKSRLNPQGNANVWTEQF